MRVRIRPGWAVFHVDRHRVGGEVVGVARDVAEHWCERGWAEPAPCEHAETPTAAAAQVPKPSTGTTTAKAKAKP